MEHIPILKMGDFLLVTIQVDMHDRLAMTLLDDLTCRISAEGPRGVLIDISGLDMERGMALIGESAARGAADALAEG